MSTHYSGGCACGALRYETGAESVFSNHCQCTDCARRSGTGHGSYLTFPDRDAVKVTGEARTWTVRADSGFDKHHAFCPACGTPVYLTFERMPGIFTVHAASLDDPSVFVPTVITYARSAFAWDEMSPALTAFETSPNA
ncbi:aldehyde-activating protein [Pseudohoeflea suaedae]|uniref:Aldehyde-activating protein n=1 Tax=Pseudohoeflea suaedae TaxID=877384 RepID=A0A4R5PNP2_9HYPH|nr:GFA family protein [Pseudohoeflea suaedae]TDH38656.1 aldehyde-activating protein [Pseudohoeflea suaedae]